MVNLNYRDSKPIYEQIRDGIINLIATGALSPGDRLPSVRELASQLAINPNTIQRAYRELELGGFIYSVTGKGSFVAESDAAVKRTEALLGQFDKTANELFRLGVTAEALIERLSKKGGNDT